MDYVTKLSTVPQICDRVIVVFKYSRNRFFYTLDFLYSPDFLYPKACKKLKNGNFLVFVIGFFIHRFFYTIGFFALFSMQRIRLFHTNLIGFFIQSCTLYFCDSEAMLKETGLW